MSVKLRINSTDIITFDLSANDILASASGSAVSAASKLNNLATQASLCTTNQCYNCNEVNCNQVKCSTTQCNQVKCSQVTVNCSECYSNCSYNSVSNDSSGGRDA